MLSTLAMTLLASSALFGITSTSSAPVSLKCVSTCGAFEMLLGASQHARHREARPPQ